MANRIIHISPHRNGWAVHYEGASRALRVTNTKKEADVEAYKIAKKYGATIISHNLDGKMRSRWIEKAEYDCFLTTACVSYYNLPDDCNQLSVLRDFRDSYLQNIKGGQELIKLYYKVAPNIVSKINKSKNKRQIYSDVFSKINTACSLISKSRFEDAKDLYILIITDLLKNFSK